MSCIQVLIQIQRCRFGQRTSNRTVSIIVQPWYQVPTAVCSPKGIRTAWFSGHGFCTWARVGICELNFQTCHTWETSLVLGSAFGDFFSLLLENVFSRIMKRYEILIFCFTPKHLHQSANSKRLASMRVIYLSIMWSRRKRGSPGDPTCLANL